MLTFPTLLEAAPIAPIGVLRAQLLAPTTIDWLIPSTAPLGEDLHGVANRVFLLSHYVVPVSEAAFSSRYFKYKV